jgi:hypothetical protein
MGRGARRQQLGRDSWWNDVLTHMILRLALGWALTSIMLMGALQMEAQRDRSQNPKRQRKAQMQMKQEREKKQNDAFRNGRKAHWKAQDRSTRKRWRAQRRAAKRMSRGGGPESWHSGIFKSRHPIPWTKRAANKIGNLFKSKRKRRVY